LLSAFIITKSSDLAKHEKQKKKEEAQERKRLQRESEKLKEMELEENERKLSSLFDKFKHGDQAEPEIQDVLD